MLGFLVAWAVFSENGEDMNKTAQNLHKAKEDKKERVIAYLKTRETITNNDVEDLLEVSDVTAYRYLEELEKEGQIQQIGKTGRAVKYQLR